MRTTGLVRWGGILLGVGLGGLANGILFHQVLQWHHVLSTAVPPTTMEAMRTNLRADGLFHIGSWLATMIAVWILWIAGQRVTAFPNSRWFVGQFFLGWGGFNLVEGLVCHQVLKLHHVRGTPDFDWDYGYLLVAGAGLILMGRRLARGGNEPDRRPRFRG